MSHLSMNNSCNVVDNLMVNNIYAGKSLWLYYNKHNDIFSLILTSKAFKLNPALNDPKTANINTSKNLVHASTLTS